MNFGMKLLSVFILIFIFFNSCFPLNDSPFSDQLRRPERNINLTALSDLNIIEQDALINIAIFSDSHQNYEELAHLTRALNKETQLDFVAGLGDFTNSAYNFEYDIFLDHISSLRHPTLNVIGNHDSIGAGPELYKKAFGPVNFYFDSKNFRFIFFNSNNLENPDDFHPQWLKDRVNETTKNVLIFTHIDLRDKERFKGQDVLVFSSIIESPNVKAVFNGHGHTYIANLDRGTIMIQCSRVKSPEGTHWLKVSIQAHQLCVLSMDVLRNLCFTLK